MRHAGRVPSSLEGVYSVYQEHSDSNIGSTKEHEGVAEWVSEGERRVQWLMT